MNKNFLEKILLSSIFFIIPLTIHAYTFNTDLTTGSSGQDVYELQKFLNNYSPQTVISQSGVGSPGNETTYFGNLTKIAVQKFQDLNFNQILKPSNLSYGTGYFGKSTRNFVNIYTNSSSNTYLPTETKPNPPTNIQKQTSYTNFLLLSKYTVKTGEEIFLAGQASTPISGLDFYIGNQKLKKNCKTEYVCSIKIDVNDIGKRYLTTNDTNISPEVITIRNKSTKTPSINLKSIKLNTETTIKGENLTEDIKIYTPFGIYESKTEDNTFRINILSPENQLKNNLQDFFYIENNDGITSDIIVIDYEI